MAFRCYCTPGELEAERSEATAARRPYRYSGRCRNLTRGEIDAFQAQGRAHTIRFRTEAFRDPARAAAGTWLQLRAADGGVRAHVIVQDMIRGEVAFDLSEIDDFIIVRSDGGALYNFANVVDDHDMRVTHVMRGIQHLTNTPKQWLMYAAFGWVPPAVAHAPELAGPDRKKLSKRHGDTSLREYRDELYLPEAMVNFFALMGWYPEDGRELFTRDELMQRYDITEMGKASPIFDRQKLNWMNGEYMRAASQRDPERVVDLVGGYLSRRGLLPAQPSEAQRSYLRRVLQILGDRIKVGADVLLYAEFFFQDPPAMDAGAVDKHLRVPGVDVFLRRVADRLATLASFTAGAIESEVRAAATEAGLALKAVVHPIRVALTGKTVGPGLFELTEVLGRDRAVARLREAAAIAAPA
jgi:glutamyl-tRNA synthetase